MPWILDVEIFGYKAMFTPLVSDGVMGCYIEIGGSMVWKVSTGRGCSTGHFCRGTGVLLFVMGKTNIQGPGI